jgi:hypothetical protein
MPSTVLAKKMSKHAGQRINRHGQTRLSRHDQVDGRAGGRADHQLCDHHGLGRHFPAIAPNGGLVEGRPAPTGGHGRCG